MTDGELDEMMATLAHVFRWDLMLGERWANKKSVLNFWVKKSLSYSYIVKLLILRYGLKAAIRAERGRLEGLRMIRLHQHHQLLGGEQLQQLGFLQHHGSVNADALSQEGMFVQNFFFFLIWGYTTRVSYDFVKNIQE